MDMGGQDKFDPEKGNEDSMKYHSPNMSSDWQFSGPNLTNTSMGLMPAANPMAVCTSSSSSASMVESFCPNIWDPPTNSQNLRFCDINVQNNASTSNTLGFRKGDLGPQSSIERTLDMGWTPPNSILKGGMFVPTMSQFPDDSGFIERAARFSCFGGGNFGAMMNLFSIPETLSPYSGGLPSMQGPQEGFGGKGVKSLSCGQSQENEMNMAQDSKDISLSVENRVTEGIPLNNDEAKQGVGLSGNESDEAGFSGGGQEEQSLLEGTCGGISAKGQGSKKRKRIGQDTELDQVKSAPKQPTDQKGDQNPTSTSNRPSGRNGKSESQASDSLKEDYIHIRARRGQATNSHSLAERVRREKISERMKFLQDLVPGCSKVTGKAVMLDEIINYVQSLQRQVEFLSMKLATVNPRLDFNIEGLLAKDMLQSRACSSSTLGFSPDMTMLYPPLHPSQPGLIQACLPGMGNSSDVLRRTISSQLASMSVGYKEPSSQVWEDELHNVVQMMGYNSSAPFNSQDLSGSLPTTGHMKAEP